MRVMAIALLCGLLLSSSLSAARPKPQAIELAFQDGHVGAIKGLVFTPDDALLVSVGFDRTVKFWDLAAGRLLESVEAGGSSLSGVAISPDGSRLVTIEAGGGLMLWDVETRKVLMRRSLAAHTLDAVVFARDGSAVYVAGAARGANPLFRVTMSDAKVEVVANLPFSPHRLSVSASGDVIVGQERQRATAVMTSGHALPSLMPREPGHWWWAQYDDSGAFMLFAVDEKARVVAQTGDFSVREANIMRGSGYTSPVLSPSGEVIAVPEDDTLRLIGLSTGATRELKLRTPYVLRFNSKGTLIAAVDVWGNGAPTISIVDVASGTVVRRLEPYTRQVRDIAFSADGSRMATIHVPRDDERGFRIWSLDSTQPLVGPKTKAHFVSDFRHYIGESGGGLRYCDLETDACTHSLGSSTPSSFITFTEDARYAAVHRGDTDIYDLRSGEKLRTDAKSAPWPRPPLPDGADPYGDEGDAARKVRERDGHAGDWSVRYLQSADGRSVYRSNTSSDPLILVDIIDARTLTTQRKLAMKSSRSNLRPPWSTGQVRRKATGIWVSRDGKSLYVYTGFSDIVKFDLATGRELWWMQLPRDRERVALSEHPSGRFFAVAWGGPSADLYDAKTGASLARAFPVNDSDYVWVKPEANGTYSYMATRGALQAINFRIGDRVYPFSQFDLRFNRPDLVLAALGLAEPRRIAFYEKLVQRRRARMGLVERELQGQLILPEARFASAPPKATREATLELDVTVKATGAAVDRIAVFINDVPVPGVPKVSARAGGEARVRVPVTLSHGDNDVQVSAIDRSGLESLRDTVLVKLEGAPPARELHVVAIGVSDYGRDELNLDFAAKDARDVAELFAKLDARFSKVKVLTLTDGDVTRDGLARVGPFLAASRVDDQIVVFAAGHGMKSRDDRYFFATSDVDPNAPERRGVAFEEIDAWVAAAPARRKLVLIDTCYSGDKDEIAVASAALEASAGNGAKARGLRLKKGATPPPRTRALLESVNDLLADLRRSSGAVVLTSASFGQTALESSAWNNGAFTRAFIDGARGDADANKDGTVRVSELRDYVVGAVQRLTAGQQRPTLKRDNLAVDFELY